MVQKEKNIEHEVILTLINGEMHLRNLSRILDTPHSTLLRKLNLLINENVLDYKTEGKNRVFFIKKNLHAKTFVFNAEKYKLIKLLKVYPEMSVILEEVIKKAENRMVILFGSYAKFLAKKDSDVDIYIETTDKKMKENIASIHSKIQIKIGAFDLSSLLIKEIIKNHVILRGVEDFYDKTKFFA